MSCCAKALPTAGSLNHLKGNVDVCNEVLLSVQATELFDRLLPVEEERVSG